MPHILWWLPCVLLYYIAFAYMSVRNNQGAHWAGLYVFGILCPFWVIVSRISHNLYRDGLIYDTAMAAAYLLGLWLLGQGEGFAARHWAGLGVMFVGFLMMRT